MKWPGQEKKWRSAGRRWIAITRAERLILLLTFLSLLVAFAFFVTVLCFPFGPCLIRLLFRPVTKPRSAHSFFERLLESFGPHVAVTE